MERMLFCVSVIVYLISSVALALPSKAWTSNGWTTESSHQSGWQNTEAKYSDTWKQASGDDSQGKGWVSSENVNDSKTKAVPTSWQQVDRHHGGSSAKNSGWTNVGQKTSSQDIAKGFVVHHPIPSSNTWNQSPSSLESWNKQNANEYWPEDVNKKSSSSSTAVWEKSITDAEEQWQQNQTPNDVPKSSWDTKSAWEKNSDTPSSTTLWNKNSSPSTWENDALNDRESAAGYAATGPVQYGQESGSISGWQEEPSNNGWQKNSPPSDAWKKDSPPPSPLYDNPSKWNNKPTNGNSDWQKASSGGWDGSSDFNTWQKETNGWTNSATKEQNQPTVSGWQQGGLSDANSNGWHKSTSANSNGWDKHGSILGKMLK